MGLRQLLLAVATATSLALVACGGPTGGYLEVDSPLIPFEAPEEDELVEDPDEDEDDEEAAQPETPDPATPSDAS